VQRRPLSCNCGLLLSWTVDQRHGAKHSVSLVTCLDAFLHLFRERVPESQSLVSLRIPRARRKVTCALRDESK
jgi:hypothetical protein